MRQVDEAELVWTLKFQLSRLSASIRNDLASRTTDVRRSAEQRLAVQLVAQALSRFEILSDSSQSTYSDLYERAAYRAPGDGSGGGAPKIREEALSFTDDVPPRRPTPPNPA